MNEDYDLKYSDQHGYETLETISKADQFNKWMFDTIRPFIKGNILEIGSGIGNISAYLLKSFERVALSDFDETYCHALKQLFHKNKNLAGIFCINLVDENFDDSFSHLFGSYDTVIALNVIEHIKDDDLAIRNCKKFLKPQGHLIVLVPAYNGLYNGFDESLGHFKRYSKIGLKKMISNKLQIEQAQFFNFAGIFGWFISGTLLKKTVIPSSQMNLYNKLVPVFKLIDKFILNKVGLSVIVVGKKI